jgi:hypothetical protein
VGFLKQVGEWVIVGIYAVFVGSMILACLIPMILIFWP